MTQAVPYGEAARMLTLGELCEWLNITERHARKLVEREAIPYRKVGRLLRFPESEVEKWSHPRRRRAVVPVEPAQAQVSATTRRPRVRLVLPKSLIEGPTDQESEHDCKRSA